MFFPFSDREAKIACAIFALGALMIPVLIGAVGYGLWRVVAATIRGW